MTRSVIDYSEINDTPIVLDRGRNMVVNGAMRISQRYIDEEVNWGGVTKYILDRMRVTGQYTAGLSTQQVDDVPPNTKFVKSMKVKCTTAQTSISASDYFDLVRHQFEGYKVAPAMHGTSNGRVTSLSFWVKSNVTGVYNFTLANATQSHKLPHFFTIAAANTWQHVKIENIPAITSGTFAKLDGSGMYLRIYGTLGTDWIGATDKTWSTTSDNTAFGSNSSQVNFTSAVNNEFYITGLQYELGSKCTDYEHKSFEQDLRECQRYYCKSYAYHKKPGVAANASVSRRATQFDTSRYWPGENWPVTMRGNPSITVWPGRTGVTANENYVTAYNGNNTASASNLYGSTAGWTSYINASGLNNMVSFHYEADAELG